MLDIFEILGPIMVGPSSSIRRGRADRPDGPDAAGRTAGKSGHWPVRLLCGDGRGHGTDRALVAGLLGMKPDDLRIPNSFAAAGEQGLEFTIHPVELREAHPNTAVLTVEGASGEKPACRRASTGGGRSGWSAGRRSGEFHRHFQYPDPAAIGMSPANWRI